MTELSKRATIYLDPALHKALRLKAASSNRSVSELVNEAVRQGVHRIHYEIQDQEHVVTLVKVGRRGDGYRN